MGVGAVARGGLRGAGGAQGEETFCGASEVSTTSEAIRLLNPPEFVQTVTSDLAFLMTEWNDKIDDQSLRRSSPVLRRLLVEGELQRAWKLAGYPGEPLIVGSTLEPLLACVPLDRIRMASAGGGEYQGNALRGSTEIVGTLSLPEIQAIQARGLPEAKLSLRRFVEATCLVLNGQPVSRRSVIKFVANRLGGVHSSNKTERKHEEIYKLLDAARDTYLLLEKPVIFFELLSTGQALARSADLRTFALGNEPKVAP